MVPPGPGEDIPQGAAVIRRGRDAFLVYSGKRVPFGECCARALQHGRLVRALPGGTEVGWFEDYEGEVHLTRQGRTILAGWLGHPVRGNDLTAWDNRAVRHQRTRRLAFQGRLAEAYRIDRRMGL